MSLSKKCNVTAKNGLLNTGAHSSDSELYQICAAPEGQKFPSPVYVLCGAERDPFVTLDDFTEDEASVSSSTKINELIENVRRAETHDTNTKQQSEREYSKKKEKRKKKKQHAASPVINNLVEEARRQNTGGHIGETQSVNRFEKKDAPQKQKSAATQKAKKKIPAISSDNIAQRFKSSYHMKVLGDILYVFNGEHYVAENKSAIIRRMKLCLTDAERSKIAYSLYEDTVKQLETDPFILLEKKPDNSGCVLFDNGMFDIRTGKRESFRPPERFCIYKVHANYLWQEVETPVFDSFLEDISGGWSDVKRLILTFIGYCLIPDLDAKCFFVLGTARDSGKSVILNFLERLIGEEVISNSTLQGLERQFGMANLTGKILNTFGDLPSRALKDSAVSNIKALTGDDKVSIEKKYKDEISYRNMAKFVFATNHPIQLQEEDDAFWERMVLIPFMVSIPKENQNKNLLDDLWAERDGIVSKAMYFARLLIKNNYVFPECQLATKMKNEWSNTDTSEVVDFIQQCCDFSDYTVKTPTDTLYDAYVKYCALNRVQPKRIEDFSHALRKNYKLPSIRVKDGIHYLRGYLGIKLKIQGGDYDD